MSSHCVTDSHNFSNADLKTEFAKLLSPLNVIIMSFEIFDTLLSRNDQLF
jgi:hypothetical protein